MVVEADLGLYDYCALVPIVEEAGGVMTDWNGDRLTLQNHAKSKGRVVACSNDGLHKEAISVLGKKWKKSLMSSFISSGACYITVGVGIGFLLGRSRVS